MGTKDELAVEVVGVSVANKVASAGAATGVLGWLSQINWIGWLGVLIALGGFAVSLYFQIRRDKREAERHEWEREESLARIAAIRDRCEP